MDNDGHFAFVDNVPHGARLRSPRPCDKGGGALAAIARRDWDAFTGLALERWFRAKLAESGQWTRIGAWWDRKGENKVDIVAENEIDGRAAFFEVKRDVRRFDENALRRKADAFLAATGVFGGYELEYRCLNLAEI